MFLKNTLFEVVTEQLLVLLEVKQIYAKTIILVLTIMKKPWIQVKIHHPVQVMINATSIAVKILKPAPVLPKQIFLSQLNL